MARTTPFLTTVWRYLVMINYEVSPEVLAPLVPAGTSLDLWEGRALVSVVGFRFLDTRVLGLPLLGLQAFTEVNLRFYVRRDVGNEVRHGVTFAHELVPHRLITLGAHLFYNEPYTTVPMRHVAPDALVEQPGRLEYAWPTGRMAATAVGSAAYAPEGSQAMFITHHLWGYTRQRDGGTVEYAVEHPYWRVWKAEDSEATIPFRLLADGKFVSAFIAEGSPASIAWPRRIPDAG